MAVYERWNQIGIEWATDMIKEGRLPHDWDDDEIIVRGDN